MPSDAGEVVMESAIGVSGIIWMTLILFWVASPIAGFYLFKLTRRDLPSTDMLALVAMAFCGFLVVFALTLLTLTQFGQMDATQAFLVSGISALLVTIVCIFVIRLALARSRVKAKQHSEEHAFRVWDEDQRTKAKNLRKKRY
jgi:ABC-type nickel/cobalt efflux system permease component RcnA